MFFFIDSHLLVTQSGRFSFFAFTLFALQDIFIVSLASLKEAFEFTPICITNIRPQIEL